ncbi:hypothetical protein DF032_14415 [Burkholderia seminalis]|nr:hypothetical protein DF032_14415 [Burkholderia seminalis]
MRRRPRRRPLRRPLRLLLPMLSRLAVRRIPSPRRRRCWRRPSQLALVSRSRRLPTARHRPCRT